MSIVTGVAQAGSPSQREYLVMVDSDVIVKPGWLEASIEALESKEAK